MDLISISVFTATGHAAGSLHLDSVKQVAALNWCTESVNRPLVLWADIPLFLHLVSRLFSICQSCEQTFPSPSLVNRLSPSPSLVNRLSPSPSLVNRLSPSPSLVSRLSCPQVLRTDFPRPQVLRTDLRQQRYVAWP